jgi:8-oxo-dGTP pyrophosphatase MutT (NUDIX family)
MNQIVVASGAKCVVGLAFNSEHDKVLLQLKKKGPLFNIGLLNGPGGKVEQYPILKDHRYESFNNAMIREFKEETGLDSQQSDWLLFHHERHPSGTDLFFYTTDKLDIMQAQTTTLEPNCIVELGYSRSHEWKYPSGYVWCRHSDGIGCTTEEARERIAVQTQKKRGGLVYNMPYLIPMALTYLRTPEHRWLEG